MIALELRIGRLQFGFDLSLAPDEKTLARQRKELEVRSRNLRSMGIDGLRRDLAAIRGRTILPTRAATAPAPAQGEDEPASQPAATEPAKANNADSNGGAR